MLAVGDIYLCLQYVMSLIEIIELKKFCASEFYAADKRFSWCRPTLIIAIFSTSHKTLDHFISPSCYVIIFRFVDSIVVKRHAARRYEAKPN